MACLPVSLIFAPQIRHGAVCPARACYPVCRYDAGCPAYLCAVIAATIS
jgi:hypothetical protein